MQDIEETLVGAFGLGIQAAKCGIKSAFCSLKMASMDVGN